MQVVAQGSPCLVGGGKSGGVCTGRTMALSRLPRRRARHGNEYSSDRLAMPLVLRVETVEYSSVVAAATAYLHKFSSRFVRVKNKNKGQDKLQRWCKATRQADRRCGASSERHGPLSPSQDGHP